MPRTSFESWKEAVPVEIEAARKLRWSLESLDDQTSKQGNKLPIQTALGLHVLGHDLREAVQAIVSEAQELLRNTGALDSAAMAKIQGMLQLTQRMQALLDSLQHPDEAPAQRGREENKPQE